MLQRPSRDPKPVLFHAVNGLSALSPLHCDILRCPMIQHMVDLPLGHKVSASRGWKRRVCKSVGVFHHRDKRAGLSTDAAWIMAGCPPGLLPRFWPVQCKWHAGLCWDRVQGLENRFGEADPAPCVKVPKVGMNAVEVEQQYRPQSPVWLWWNLWMKLLVGTQPVAKDYRLRGQNVTKHRFI